jgi:5-methylcytosine-specific restriction endonuclease McrA
VVSEETRKKLIESHRGKIPWNKGLKGWNAGHFVSDATKEKIREKLKGNKNSLGFKHSVVRNKKISEALKGKPGKVRFWQGKKRPEMSKEKNWRWKGGITPENHRIRTSLEFKEWRRKVFERDNYACQCCGTRKNLHPHHLYSFAGYPEYRFETWNGQTLCENDHMHLHRELGMG